MKNNKYNGRGTLYGNNFYDGGPNDIIYDGYFMDGKYEGYGILYHNYTNNPKYRGFFEKGKYNGKGILYSEKCYKIYEGNFSDGKYNGIGIEYYYNYKNQKSDDKNLKRRKMFYENGKPLKKCYGILYKFNNKNESFYQGLLCDEKPENLKNFN